MGLARLVRAAPAGARFGVHLCLGDMNHRALGRMDDLGPVVALANALAAKWPQGRPLAYVHAPFGAADVPPSVDPAFTAPLADLRLPSTTRFVAGLVHEHVDVDQQRAMLARVEGLVGSTADVAAACGLGRRDRDDALESLRQAAALST